MNLTPLFQVLGIAGTAHLVCHVLDESGYGKFNMFVRIGAYSACAYIVYDLWMDAVNYVASMFRVPL